MKQLCLFCYCCFLGLAFPYMASGQSLFDSEELLELRLAMDISALQADRGNDPDYHDATLTFQSLSGEAVEFPVEVKARGRFRRDKYVCVFPPIRLKFGKKADPPPPFDHQNKLKVVTHCQADEYILREYYVYKVHNLITERSFRVRLARITYVDTSGKEADETHYAFLIESEDEMARRNGGESISEDVEINSEDVDSEALTQVHVFQFMVANKDFDVRVRQNLKVITNSERGGRPIPIPYDFDWAGIVDASYTKLSGKQDKPVYFDRRHFKTLCRSEAEFQAVFDHFLAKKDAIFALYQQSPYLSQTSIQESLKYYKDFFKTIRKKGKIEKIFLDSCES